MHPDYTPKDAARFWSRIDKSDDEDACWNWTGGTAKFGHGKLNLRSSGRTWYAHRFAWLLTQGHIPSDLCVLHKCDNPLCCNPKHLFLGTRVDNIQDMVNKGRVARGEAKGKLTQVQVNEIRERHANGNATRRELAKEYGVTISNIGMIITRRTWNDSPAEKRG